MKMLMACMVAGAGLVWSGPMVCDGAEDGHDHDHGEKVAATKPAAKGADDHDHDHAPKAPPTAPAGKSADGHAGHDHDHDHGSEAAHADEVKLTAESVRTNGIVIGTASRQKLAAMFVAPARVAFNAEAMAHVGAAVRGRVTEVKVKIGAVVAQGDELLVVESAELGEAQSDLLQKRTMLEVAEAAVDPLKDSYERAKKLFDQNEGIALTDVQKRMTDWRAAQGAVLTAKAAAVAAENKLHLMGMDQAAVQALLKSSEIHPKYVIRAPIAGTVITREVTQGELVNPDKDALLVLADLSTLWVWADVPEAKLGEIEKGTLATIETAAAQAAIAGKVAQIAPQIDASTRTGKVRIDVANGQGGLRPGMFAKVELTSGGGKGEPVLVVPAGAVMVVEGKPAVFVPVEGEANTFAKREVTVGKATGGLVPVLSGLKEGEKVVTGGVFVLKAELGKSGAAHEH